MIRVILFLIVLVFLFLFFPAKTNHTPKLHIHRDVLAASTIHRESLPIENIHKALGNSPITAVQSRLAVKLALRRWGKTRCPSPIRLLRAHLLPLNIIAQAQWSTGLNSKVYLDCSVTFNSSRANLTFPFYCATMTHEYGHLSGYFQKGGLDHGIHSKYPASVMYPILSHRNIPRYCQISGFP